MRFSRPIDIGCDYKIRCTSIDQCALNVTFARDWMQLPAGYNMQAGAKFTRGWKTASVRHYCGPRKFVPLAPFRSDSRDIAYLNVIHDLLGRPTSRFSLAYGLLHALNSNRNYRSSSPMRNFILAYERQFGAPTLAGRPSGAGIPYEIRTRVTAVKGRCPRPLDERDEPVPHRDRPGRAG